MIDLIHPYSGAVISVPEDAVDRYIASGWRRHEAPRRPARKAAGA